MYAAQGHKLRDDWLGDQKSDDLDRKLGTQKRLVAVGRAAGQSQGVLANVAATEFLQAIAVLHTKEVRLAAMADPTKTENDWPAVRATRQPSTWAAATPSTTPKRRH